MERNVFVQYVQDALVHLQDPVILRDHPLAPVLLPSVATGDRDTELSHLLTAAIEQLRPSESGDAGASAARRYQYLSLRYVQGVRASQVAQALGLSERQTRRVHQEAIEALASAVWAKRRARRPGPDSSARRLAPDLDAEVARLGATPSRCGAYVGDTLKGALATVAPLAQQRSVRFEVEVVPSLPPVAVDRAVLRQVFVNLLVAVVEKGAQSIAVRAAASDRNVAIALTIRFRVGNDDRPAGLLSAGEPFQVVRRLIALQGGALEIHGTDPATLGVSIGLPLLKPSTVLLVDDNPDTLRLLRRFLTGGLYRTIEATNGRQAMELALRAHPDAVVLDVMMPTQDGWETLQALRHDLETEDIPVVVCSVLRQRELALSLGASDFLEKPISREALLATLDRHLKPVPALAPRT